jgi:hypothetical protein
MPSLTPARGLLLVRPVDTAETLPGGRIILTPDARHGLTANQCEVIAVGAFAVCDPARSRAERRCARAHDIVYEHTDDCPEMIDTCTRELRVHPHPIRPGDWLLVEPRSFLAGPDPERKEWLIHQDAVWGVFHTEESK